MDTWPSWGALVGGVLASNAVLGGVLHWIHAVVEILKSRADRNGNGAMIGQLVVGSLLNTGPWILLIAAYFSFYVSSQSWASSFFVGAVAWLVFVCALVTYFMWKIGRRERAKNVA